VFLTKIITTNPENRKTGITNIAIRRLPVAADSIPMISEPEKTVSLPEKAK
jgi:hypothetical protein